MGVNRTTQFEQTTSSSYFVLPLYNTVTPIVYNLCLQTYI